MATGTKRVRGRKVLKKGYRYAKGGRGRVIKVARKATGKRRRVRSRRRCLSRGSRIVRVRRRR